MNKGYIYNSSQYDYARLDTRTIPRLSRVVYTNTNPTAHNYPTQQVGSLTYKDVLPLKADLYLHNSSNDLWNGGTPNIYGRHKQPKRANTLYNDIHNQRSIDIAQSHKYSSS